MKQGVMSRCQATPMHAALLMKEVLFWLHADAHMHLHEAA